jgi:Flp pilus assembly protein TadD
MNGSRTPDQRPEIADDRRAKLHLSELQTIDNPPLHYHLGCYAARAGRREDALEHISKAFELNPKAREWAPGTKISTRSRTS